MDFISTPIIVASVFELIEPYLVLIAKGSMEKISEIIPESVGKLWNKIFDGFNKSPGKEKSLEDIMNYPDDKDIQASFRVQLRKIIDEDPSFRSELLTLIGNNFPDTSFKAELHGNGAISQGSNSKSVGANGILLDGKDITINLQQHKGKK